MFELTDKVIIITGASSGIGRSCAIRCSMQGAKIALIGRDEKKLRETLSLLSGDGHHIYLQDITNYVELPELVSEIREEMGYISGREKEGRYYIHSKCFVKMFWLCQF